MSGLVDRTTAAVHLPNTVFPSGIQCSCDRRLVLPSEQWAEHVAERVAEALPDAYRQLHEIRQLIAAYREADPPDIGHRIYVDIETILDDWPAVEDQPQEDT